MLASIPLCNRRQAHQNGIGVVPGFQTKLGAPVIDKVIFGIKPPTDQLDIALYFGKRRGDALLDQGHKGGQKGAAYVLGQCKICRPVAGVQIIIENTPHAPRSAPVRDKEILIRPSLEFGVLGNVMRITSHLHLALNMRGVFGILDARVQI